MDLFVEKVKSLEKKYKGIYIYGAGLFGQRVYKIFKENRIPVCGFVVTNDSQCNKKLFDLQVLNSGEIDLSDFGIVVAANRRNSIEIMRLLKGRNCNDDGVLCACEYLDNRKLDEEYSDLPMIDVTTVIGCKVNCKYCPQQLLLKSYYYNNPKRDSVMTMETFAKCLEHLPEKCNIMFCGMSEPFLNPLCDDMICKAFEAGKSVELYTTLVGLTQEKLEKIWDMPLSFVNIHVADVYGYANIPVTEEYIELFKNVINHKRKDGSSFVNVCNAQDEPHPKVKEICRGKFDIATALHDRAGNLNDDKLIHKQNYQGALSCTQCGQELNHNILLPDGTLLLCCMDYGMQHELGNLKENTYEEIMGGERIKRIKEGLMGNEKIDILCRSCSFASRIN